MTTLLTQRDHLLPATEARPTCLSRKQRRLRSARQALATGVLAFCALQALLALSAETWFPALRDPPFWTRVHHLQERIASTKQAPATIIMLGSSSAVFAFKGPVLERDLAGQLDQPVVAYNFGYWGRGLFSQYLHLHRLVRAGVRPEIVLVEVWPLFLHGGVRPNEHQTNNLQYAELALAERWAPQAQRRADWWFSAANPLVAHRRAILSRLHRRLLPLAEQVEWWDDAWSGWMPLVQPPASAARPRQEIGFFATMKRDIKDLRATGESLQVLEELLRLGREHDITMVLILMPEGPALRRLYAPGVWEKTLAMLEPLQERYGMPRIVARHWLEEQDFADSVHAHPHGAEKFSARLAGELAPILRGALARAE
jgi:hypothetical protein